jgi:hypothetical protein
MLLLLLCVIPFNGMLAYLFAGLLMRVVVILSAYLAASRPFFPACISTLHSWSLFGS